MPLIAKSLGQEALDSIQDAEAGTVAYLKAIQDYVEGNIQIQGMYNGVIPGPPPVPEVNLPIAGSLTISPAFAIGATVKIFLTALQSADPSGFVQALVTGLTGSMVQINSPFSGPPMPVVFVPQPFTPVELKSLSEAEKPIDIWTVIGDKLIAIITSMVIPPVTPVMSPAGGTGAAVFNSVS